MASIGLLLADWSIELIRYTSHHSTQYSQVQTGTVHNAVHSTVKQVHTGTAQHKNRSQIMFINVPTVRPLQYSPMQYIMYNTRKQYRYIMYVHFHVVHCTFTVPIPTQYRYKDWCIIYVNSTDSATSCVLIALFTHVKFDYKVFVQTVGMQYTFNTTFSILFNNFFAVGPLRKLHNIVEYTALTTGTCKAARQLGSYRHAAVFTAHSLHQRKSYNIGKKLFVYTRGFSGTVWRRSCFLNRCVHFCNDTAVQNGTIPPTIFFHLKINMFMLGVLIF